MVSTDLVFARWTSNDGNLYFGTLALTTIVLEQTNMFLRLFLALWELRSAHLVSQHFMTFLGWQLWRFPLATGIVIVDGLKFIQEGECHYGENTSSFLRIVALIAWVAGAAVGF